MAFGRKNIKIDRFAFQVALSSGVGYCVSVGFPVLSCPYLKNSIFKICPCKLPPGQYILLPAILILLIIYGVNIMEYFHKYKLAFTLSVFLFITWLSSYTYFRLIYGQVPPNEIQYLVIVPVIFGLIIASSIYIHDYPINFKFIEDNSISELTKIELTKMHYETWVRLLHTIITAYAAIAISFTAFIPTLAHMMDSDQNGQFLIFNFIVFPVVLTSMVFLAAVCAEIFRKIITITKHLEMVKKDKLS